MVAETLASVRRNMKVSSYVEGGSRQDVPDYPEVAIHEAVANALMHRDYSPEGVASQVQVNMFEDRIEIISPGGLFGMVTVDNIGTYGASSRRNQYFSRILESAPYPEGYPEKGYVVENKGTGFAQIQAALKKQGMEPAKPEDSLSFFAVTMCKADPVIPNLLLVKIIRIYPFYVTTAHFLNGNTDRSLISAKTNPYQRP